MVDGFIVENGRRALRVVMESDSLIRLRLNIRELGPMDCKTVMDRKHTRTTVSFKEKFNRVIN